MGRGHPSRAMPEDLRLLFQRHADHLGEPIELVAAGAVVVAIRDFVDPTNWGGIFRRLLGDGKWQLDNSDAAIDQADLEQAETQAQIRAILGSAL